MTVREPEWTEVDRAEAFAFAEYQRSRCEGCGQSLTDTLTHEEAGPGFRAEHLATCRGCMELIDRRRAADGDKPSPYRNAQRWVVHTIGG